MTPFLDLLPELRAVADGARLYAFSAAPYIEVVAALAEKPQRNT
jgi:hypothetical protein